jgi:hypothetical protein
MLFESSAASNPLILPFKVGLFPVSRPDVKTGSHSWPFDYEAMVAGIGRIDKGRNYRKVPDSRLCGNDNASAMRLQRAGDELK